MADPLYDVGSAEIFGSAGGMYVAARVEATLLVEHEGDAPRVLLYHLAAAAASGTAGW